MHVYAVVALQFSVRGSGTLNIHKPTCSPQVNIQTVSGRKVLVTPLSSVPRMGPGPVVPSDQETGAALGASTNAQGTGMINKLLIKVFSSVNKKESKTFTLKVGSCDKLKAEIALQLKDDVILAFCKDLL